MPYVFVFLLIVNIAVLGYFLLLGKPSNIDSPAELEAKASITEVVTVENPNRGK